MRIATLNVRHAAGARDAELLIQIAHSMHIDVLALQSTCCTTTKTAKGYTYYSVHHTGIIYRTTLDLDIHTDPTGRILTAVAPDLTIVSAYCPFSDLEAQNNFWERLTEYMSHIQTPNVLLLGDFNAHTTITDLRCHGQTVRISNDHNQYPQRTDPNGQALLQLALQHNLTTHNFEQTAPFHKRATCRNANGNSIIDYCLSHLVNYHCTGVAVKQPMYQTDHNMLVATLNAKKRPAPPRALHPKLVPPT